MLELFQQAPVAIAVFTGPTFIIEFANPEMCGLWGRSQEEVLHKPLFEALPEVANQGFEEILSEVLATAETYEGKELPITLERDQKLELCYFNLIYKPLRNEKNEIKGIIEVATEVTDLVETRKQAERNEELLRISLAGGKMGTWHLDLLAGKSSQSIEYARILGYEEVQQQWGLEQYLKHVHPEEKSLVKDIVQNGLHTGYLNYETRIIRADKAVRWVRISGKTTYNLKGKPISISGVIMDITDQKEALIKERQLVVERVAREEAEKQRKALFDLLSQAPALICTFYGPKLVFGFVNAMYQRLYPGRKLEGKPMLKAVPELKGQPLIDIITKVYKTGEAFSGKEVPVQIDRSGKGQLETAYFNITYQALRDTTGTVNGIMLFAFEVTEQIQARKQVESSEESLRIALEAGKMGIWHLDLINDISTRSPLHDQIFGYSKPIAEWGYKQFMAHVQPKDYEYVANQFEIAGKYGDLRFEARILGADQKLRWISVKGQTFYEDEKPVRMAGVVMDITERKMVEEKLTELTEELAFSNNELIKANQEIQLHMQELSQTNNKLRLINADLDNFVYTASHDLKTPISNIEGLIQLLIRNLSEEDLTNEAIQKPISLIGASIERFKTTIVELTNIARLQKEEETNPLTDLEMVLQEVELDLQFTIEETGATLETNLNNCSRLPLSHKNLKSVIYNLLSNALKYRSPEHPPLIKINCIMQEGWQVLTVQDNGLGIKEKDQQKIFSMFTRMHTHVEGSGVGLYLVKRIIDTIGGKLEVKSKEGEGATFIVYFPLS